jgi:hypothetical protein
VKSKARKAADRAKTERKQAFRAGVVGRLRASGHTCGDCQHRGERFGAGPVCELASDFHGYTRVALTDLCADWKGA